MTPKKKILLVDDSKVVLDILSEKLKELSFEAEIMERPTKNFVEKVLEIKPDLISLDVVMPDINGFEAIQMLKNDSRTKDIPVIFSTNLSQPEEINKGISLGAIDYLPTTQLTPDDLVKCYIDYLNNPKDYIKRYPAFIKKIKDNDFAKFVNPY